MSEETAVCVECHREKSPALYEMWGKSKHYGANVGCFECHMAKEGEPDAFMHEGQFIATIVSPKDGQAIARLANSASIWAKTSVLTDRTAGSTAASMRFAASMKP